VTTTTSRTLAAESLSTTWLASRLGTQPGRIDSMRRAGELLGVRSANGEYFYPGWQFDGRGKPLPIVRELIRTARAAGLDDNALYEVLSRRTGMSGRRLADHIRTGDPEYVLRAVRSAVAAA
jgi:hypothetical protein